MHVSDPDGGVVGDLSTTMLTMSSDKWVDYLIQYLNSKQLSI